MGWIHNQYDRMTNIIPGCDQFTIFTKSPSSSQSEAWCQHSLKLFGAPVATLHSMTADSWVFCMSAVIQALYIWIWIWKHKEIGTTPCFQTGSIVATPFRENCVWICVFFETHPVRQITLHERCNLELCISTDGSIKKYLCCYPYDM